MLPNTQPTDRGEEQLAASRLESFSDGVIAVIITIMVLEFKVPREPGPKAFISAVAPTLAVYLLSFTYTGIYWINHNHLVHRLKHVDAPILYANLLLLFCLSLLPFATSYVLSENLNSFSIVVYAGELFLSGLAFVVLSASITRHFHRTGSSNPARLATQKAEARKSFVSLGLYVLAAPLAYWHPLVAVGALAAGTLLWIVPGFMLPGGGHERAD
ncbi:MAG: TMEM175 family protein [Terriglobales bacterium]